ASLGLHDQHATPLGHMYGLEVLATAVSNLLQGDALRAPSALATVLLAFAAALLSALITLVLGRRAALVALLVLVAAGWQLALWMLSARNALLPYTAMALAGGATWLLLTEEMLSV